MAVGDISLQLNNDSNPFKNVEYVLKQKDILFGNLETVLSDNGKRAEKSVLLNSDPQNIKHLLDAGFDIVNIANNHIMDLGEEGICETMSVLQKNKIYYIGANNKEFDRSYVVIDRNKIKLGFLGYDAYGKTNNKQGAIVNHIDHKSIQYDVNRIKEKCDFIIVSLHWGIENVFYPSPEQIKLARKIIDAGASIVLGHHPHVIQGIEEYKNGLIVYSLGNFQFNSLKEKNRISIILSVEIEDHGIEQYNIIPTKISSDFSPLILNAQESKQIRSFVKSISMPIIKGRINTKWWFERIAQEYLRGNIMAWIIRIRKYGIMHFLMFVQWILSPFTLKCFLGLLRQKINNNDKRLY